MDSSIIREAFWRVFQWASGASAAARSKLFFPAPPAGRRSKQRRVLVQGLSGTAVPARRSERQRAQLRAFGEPAGPGSEARVLCGAARRYGEKRSGRGPGVVYTPQKIMRSCGAAGGYGVGGLPQAAALRMTSSAREHRLQVLDRATLHEHVQWLRGASPSGRRDSRGREAIEPQIRHPMLT